MRRVLVALQVVSLSFFVACGGSDDAEPQGAEAEGGSSAQIVASDFSFSPTSLEAAPGDSLEITLVNEDSAAHSVTFEDPQFEIETDGGSEISSSLEVPAGDATYEYFCKYHPDTMRGELTVGTGGTGGGSGDAPAGSESEAPEDDGAYDY